MVGESPGRSESERTDGAPEDEPPTADQAAGEAQPRRRPKRMALPASLPREERVIDLPEHDKECACGHVLVRIGEDSAERLDVIPPRVRVLRTVRPKYACHHCEGSGDEDRLAVRVAPAPPALIPKGLASEGLPAYIATAKFCDALPLYRQERQFARLGVELLRRTMSDWMIATAAACEPLLELLLERLRSGPKLQIDETTVQVLKEPDRDNTTKSYVWVARGGPPETPTLVYRYAPSRGAWVAEDIIGDYQGYVQTDGYEGYVRPCSRPGIVHVGCMAHVRRAFKEAADAQGKVSNRGGTARQAVAYIAKPYRIESELSAYRESDPDHFLAERRARAQPVLDKMHGWLRQKQPQVPPGTALGKAITFALGQWPKLIRYLDHAQLTPDNNSCEQAIRPFVIAPAEQFQDGPNQILLGDRLIGLVQRSESLVHVSHVPPEISELRSSGIPLRGRANSIGEKELGE